MMLEVGAFEAKNRLSELLTRVEQGEDVVITRRGRAVARLVRAEQGHDPAQAMAAVERILARGRRRSLGGLSIKQMIEEGRR